MKKRAKKAKKPKKGKKAKTKKHRKHVKVVTVPVMISDSAQVDTEPVRLKLGKGAIEFEQESGLPFDVDFKGTKPFGRQHFNHGNPKTGAGKFTGTFKYSVTVGTFFNDPNVIID